MTQTIKENENVILDLNFQDQLYEKGEDATGKKLPLPYSPFTINIKKLKGQPINRITLYDTGDFYRSGKLKVSMKGFIIDATDWKKDKLVKEWGQILGLNNENLEEIRRNYILPECRKALRNALRM